MDITSGDAAITIWTHERSSFFRIHNIVTRNAVPESALKELSFSKDSLGHVAKRVWAVLCHTNDSFLRPFTED